MASKNTIAVALTPELLEQLQVVAREDALSASAVVRLALKGFFLRRKMTNSHEERAFRETLEPAGVA